MDDIQAGKHAMNGAPEATKVTNASVYCVMQEMVYFIQKIEMKMIDDDESKYADVPSDFPRPASFSTLPGVQPKVVVTEYKGKFYPPEGTPPEIYERWQSCEELAREFASESRKDKAAYGTLMTETEMLERYLRIFNKSWLSEDEAKWMVRRMSQILGWPVPSAAST